MSLKLPLSEDAMTVRAMEVHREMVRRETRCPGDTENAMRRLEAAFGLDYWAQWQVRYRKEITPTFAHRVVSAWASVLERSVANDIEAWKREQSERGTCADPDLADLLEQAEALLAKIKERKATLK